MGLIFKSYKQKVKQKLLNQEYIAWTAVCEQARANAVREANRMIYDTPESPNYVRTGNYRNSLSTSIVLIDGDYAGVVGTNISYAPYIEYGSTHGRTRIKAKPVLHNTIESDRYLKQYKKLFETALRKLNNG